MGQLKVWGLLYILLHLTDIEMKRHLLIDHLPVGKTFTYISEIYRSFNPYLSGLSFSDFPIKWNYSSPDYLNKPITIEMIGSTKYLQITNIHTQVTSLPVSTTHGTLLPNNNTFITNWLFENEVRHKTNEISFKIKFTKDSVSMANVKHCMIATSTRSACLFFEDFGNYKKNDEFDVKVVVNFDGSSKTYIDGILLANYTTAIIPINSPLLLGFILFPSISYEIGTRTNEFGIRDVVISGYDEITEPFKNVASSIVSLQSEDLSVMTTLPYDGTVLPFTDKFDLIEKSSISRYMFTIDSDTLYVVPSASIRLNKGFIKRTIRYYITQDNVIKSSIGTIIPVYTTSANITLEELFITDVVDYDRPVYLCFEDMT